MIIQRRINRPSWRVGGGLRPHTHINTRWSSVDSRYTASRCLHCVIYLINACVCIRLVFADPLYCSSINSDWSTVHFRNSSTLPPIASYPNKPYGGHYLLKFFLEDLSRDNADVEFQVFYPRTVNKKYNIYIETLYYF